MAAQTPVFKEHEVAMAFAPGQAMEEHADEQVFLLSRYPPMASSQPLTVMPKAPALTPGPIPHTLHQSARKQVFHKRQRILAGNAELGFRTGRIGGVYKG